MLAGQVHAIGKMTIVGKVWNVLVSTTLEASVM